MVEFNLIKHLDEQNAVYQLSFQPNLTIKEFLKQLLLHPYSRQGALLINYQLVGHYYDVVYNITREKVELEQIVEAVYAQGSILNMSYNIITKQL